MAFVMPDVPLAILDLPIGTYGISYDIGTRDTKDDLPNGWHCPRGESNSILYFQLIIFFSKYIQKDPGCTTQGTLCLAPVMVQYSDYRRPDSHLAEVWTVMVGLGQLPPLGKIQSTLRRLKMHHIHNLDVMDKVMDVTNQLRLGELFPPHS
jgi:hypothetical protein